MKNILIFSIIIIFTGSLTIGAQSSDNSIIGAWQTSATDDQGSRYTITTIIADGFFSTTKYSMLGQKFYSTEGGKLTVSGNAITKTYEYNTIDKGMVGTVSNSNYSITDKTLTFSGDENKWTKVDDHTVRDFSGAYLITGRKRNGEISRSTPGARKTMKILSGPYFQWIAYNTDTGEFFGTGGGTYTTVDGKYTEQIEFFSRDGSKIGATLQFDYDLQNGEWHHSGLSSKGDPIYEIWTLRSNL